ncbi:hypothetical protein [Shinella sp. HZN7]|uniref:hypothetical protein n=1 Tax=Shinella sp. (strain HZN7) TaxID=879274 RepID=UPI000AC0DC62|nr:hypothetical protein [Shinella sp. HZN7]
MTFDDRMNALPDDEEISRKYPRQDASGIFEIDTETDIDTHFACWKFPIIPSPCARWADVDLFGTAFVKPTAPMKNWLPMPDTLPCRKKVRQYVDGRAYSGELRDEARKLYNAMSFKVLRDGWGFNTFITVTAKYLGLTSHAEFATLIPVMNKAVAGWLKARPKRSARFHMTEETNHSYIFVLERSGYTHGLHFHMLCTVPVDLRDEFRVFLADWWEQQSGLAAPKNAVDVKYSNSWGRPEHYANQALKFRYTIKTVPEDFWVFDHEGRKQYAVEFMKPWLPHGERPDILPIRTRQIYGISRDLDTKARQKWGEEVGWTFVSKFDQRRLDELYSGSEVQAWQARLINEPDWWELY